MGDPTEAGRLSHVLDEWCEVIGRDPSQIERSILLAGRPQAEQADDYLANGITHLIIGVNGPGSDLDVLRELVAWRDARVGEALP
jgi:hypothetical protein